MHLNRARRRVLHEDDGDNVANRLHGYACIACRDTDTGRSSYFLWYRDTSNRKDAVLIVSEQAGLVRSDLLFLPTDWSLSAA